MTARGAAERICSPLSIAEIPQAKWRMQCSGLAETPVINSRIQTLEDPREELTVGQSSCII